MDEAMTGASIWWHLTSAGNLQALNYSLLTARKNNYKRNEYTNYSAHGKHFFLSDDGHLQLLNWSLPRDIQVENHREVLINAKDN